MSGIQDTSRDVQRTVCVPNMGWGPGSFYGQRARRKIKLAVSGWQGTFSTIGTTRQQVKMFMVTIRIQMFDNICSAGFQEQKITGPNFIFVHGLVKFVPAVARLICQDQLGSC